MSLLHYLSGRAAEFGITLSALNCDHGMRPTSSVDSEFVAKQCALLGVPLLRFVWETSSPKTETSARLWRRECYMKAIEGGAEAIATAHHLNDNAETVLFNLARGASLAGLTGITDGDSPFRIIRPMIACTREQIDDYAEANAIPFVEDETNFTDDYSRNRIRHHVLPELERAASGAAEALFRFSRLAAADEKFFADEIARRNILEFENGCAHLAFCDETALFSRAAVSAIKSFGKTDYTQTHVNTLYGLQFKRTGKSFEFLNLTARREGSGITIFERRGKCLQELAFSVKTHLFDGQTIKISLSPLATSLKFDPDAIPAAAVIRTRRTGDKFKKFGGGLKSLSDFFTDRKIPAALRDEIPLVADGDEILIVCGVEISDKIKVTPFSRRTAYLALSGATSY